MKILCFLLFLSAQSAFAQNLDIFEVRNLLEQSIEKEEAATKLLSLLDNMDESSPLFYGYKGVANMMLSKHKTFPWKKWEYFKKGKKMLEMAISEAPSNYELRFLRYSIQSKVPGFLGYSDNLEEDRERLMEGYPNLNDAYLKKSVKNILKLDS